MYYEILLKEIMKTINLKNVPIYHSSENEYKEYVLKYLLVFNQKYVFRDYTLNMYKMVSKITKFESSLVDGNTLATNLCVVYFALDIYYSNADVVLIGKNQREFFETTQNVIQFNLLN